MIFSSINVESGDKKNLFFTFTECKRIDILPLKLNVGRINLPSLVKRGRIYILP